MLYQLGLLRKQSTDLYSPKMSKWQSDDYAVVMVFTIWDVYCVRVSERVSHKVYSHYRALLIIESH